LTLSTSPGEPESVPGRLLYRGAEADIILGEWSGVPAVYKVRRRMDYRLEALDRALRRQRTVHEASMIAAARQAGVASPFLFFLNTPHSTIVMEYVRGRRMKDLVASGDGRASAELFRRLGSNAARLHLSGIMHGDLTTANVIVRDGALLFIDFGLSVHTDRIEDRAVDLRLIKETITGAHASIATTATEALLEGYEEVAGQSWATTVRRQLAEIERRGRYARVE
jgi:TP53 regulating kinase-like protein